MTGQGLYKSGDSPTRWLCGEFAGLARKFGAMTIVRRDLLQVHLPFRYRPPDFGQDSPSLYSPDKLDVDQWISVVRDAGAKYAVLTTKFNDGFCLWPSKLTNYTVANSANKTDVVAKFMEACDKHGIIPGFYYNSNGSDFKRISKW